MRALSDVLGVKLPYDSLAALRQALFAAHPHLARIGQVMPSGPVGCAPALAWRAATSTRRRSRPPIDDFYLTNPIARASAIMAECSALAEARTTMTAAE